jgi:sodium-dependent dicarboxylate transporter 2/3/5
MAASLAFVLPVSTPPNAIVYGTGKIPILRMVQAGLLLDAIGGVLIWCALRILGPLLGIV